MKEYGSESQDTVNNESISQNNSADSFKMLLEKEDFLSFLDETGLDKDALIELLQLLVRGYIKNKKKQPGTDRLGTDKNESSGKRKVKIPLEHLRLNFILNSDYDSLGRENEVIENLYRLGAAYTLENILKILSDSNMQKLFFNLRLLDLNQNSAEILKTIHNDLNKDAQDGLDLQIKDLFSWIQMLSVFSPDKISNRSEKKKDLVTPFEKINPNDKRWENLIAISENFGHALKKIFNADVFFMYIHGIKSSQESDFENPNNLYTQCHTFLHHQAKALDGFMRLLEGYKANLLDLNKEKQISNWYPILYNVEQMLNARAVSISDDLVPLSLKIPSEESKANRTLMRYADENQLMRAFYEISKNAFDETKFDEENAKYFDGLKKPYFNLDIKEIKDERGNDMICFAFKDQGAPIDIHKLEAESGNEIKTLEDIMDALSTRGLSLSENTSHAGVGLSEARRIIREHNGEILCNNLSTGNVGFVVLIPKDGKRNRYNYKLVGNNVKVFSNENVAQRRYQTRANFGAVLSRREE